jgi:hypothetical protein
MNGSRLALASLLTFTFLGGSCHAGLFGTPGEEEADTTGATSLSIQPTVDTSRRYRFVPDPKAEVLQSPYFDLVKDTPDFDNYGNVFLPGGSCFGFTFVIYEHYQALVYPFLGKKRGVSGWYYSKSGSYSGESDGYKLIHLEPKNRFDQMYFDQYRMRGLTAPRPSKMRSDRDQDKTREYQRKRIASLSLRQFDSIMRRQYGAAAAAAEWTRDLTDPSIGLGIVSFTFDSGGGHAVLVYKAQDGKAIPEGTPDETPGVAATAFWMVDSNSNYQSEEVGKDQYMIFFHQAKRIGFSPAYRDQYVAVLHRGAYHGVQDVRFRVPPTGKELWNLDRDIRGDIGTFATGDDAPGAMDRLERLYARYSDTNDPQALALALELRIAEGGGNSGTLQKDLAFVRKIAPRPDFQRFLKEAKRAPSCDDALCIKESLHARYREWYQQKKDLQAKLRQTKKGTTEWYATRNRLRLLKKKMDSENTATAPACAKTFKDRLMDLQVKLALASGKSPREKRALQQQIVDLRTQSKNCSSTDTQSIDFLRHFSPAIRVRDVKLLRRLKLGS